MNQQQQNEEQQQATLNVLFSLTDKLSADDLLLLMWHCGVSVELFDSFPLTGYGSRYVAFRDGRIYSNIYNRFLRGRIDGKGYLQVVLSDSNHVIKSHQVHRLIASVFVKGRTHDRREINHKDGNKLNNNDSNLEWVTRSENILHAYATGLKVPPSSCRAGELNGYVIGKKRKQLEKEHEMV